MQTKTNLLQEIKKSVNGDGNTDKLITKMRNNEVKEETKGKGKINKSTFNIIK